MKYIFLLLALMAVYTPAFSQTGSGIIKGTVTDSAKNNALDYVTVSLQANGSTEILKSTYTNEKGSFSFTGLEFKPYQILISYVGYQPQTIKTETLSSTNPVISLPEIKLKANSKQLEEVAVISQKMLVTQDVDKLSYDVEADPESKSNTVLDMLRKVPLVTVDANDNIQLKGKSSFKVLLNGKTSALFARDPKEVLKSMPASSVKKIEVITNPPAKYEAEGAAGIINIITNKSTPAGYNGSADLGANTFGGYSTSTYVTAKTGRLGASANYGLYSWNSPESTSRLSRTDLLYNTQLNQIGHRKDNGKSHYGGLDLSFEIDSLNLLTANANLYQGDSKEKLNQQVSMASGDVLLQNYRRQNSGNDYWIGQDVGLDYQHTFRKNKEQLLTLSYKYSLSGFGNQINFNYEPLLNYKPLSGKTDNDNKSQEHTFQVDYVQPFGANNLEAGLKSISRLNNSKYYYDTLDQASGTFINLPEQTNNFDYHQNIYAAYTSVTLKKNDWGLKIGARLEETKTNAAFRSSETIARQDYFNLVPSVAVSRKLKEMQDLKLSYNQRIERPGLWYLNPYADRTDVKNISYGNPDLNAVTSNNFDLAHSTFIKNSSFNSSLSYSLSNNAIQQFTTAYPDSAVTTYGNLGREQSYGFSESANLSLTKNLNLNLNTTFTYIILNGFLQDKPLRNEGLTASFFGSGSYKFEKNWRLSANGGYFPRSVTLQGRTGNYYYNSFTLSKTFLKGDKATIKLMARSPFQKNRKSLHEVNDLTFNQLQESIYQQRNFGLTFSYKFGKLEDDIARKRRGISNDDLKGGKSGGSGN